MINNSNLAIGIIPARYASTRFPGKPLVDIAGKTMIQRVYEQASKAKSLSKVVVATDDERIADEVKRFGGEFVFTGSQHQSGTDRCAEVIEKLPDYEIRN
ncbi:cytidylyltransferase domain-containing protein [Pedobacter agri]|uniref:cytidylyltransferase domain-containing protein n=1 Tax=Pedobacter agri TaxID=454586 RepID=UPI00029AF189|nr:NTP transferase domain-containing protein [Pedobacter agri]